MKAMETPEEKRLRRLAKKEAKERRQRLKEGWDLVSRWKGRMCFFMLSSSSCLNSSPFSLPCDPLSPPPTLSTFLHSPCISPPPFPVGLHKC